MTAQYSDIVSDGGMDPRNQFDNKHPSLAIVATGIPASLEDYQVALNAAFAGGAAYGKATASERLERIADDLQELCDKQALRIGNLEMMAAVNAGREIKLAMAEANDERLARRHPACFADWQDSHATDRGCGNCNLRYECRTGDPEQERAAFLDWCFSVGLMAQSHGLRSESSDCETAWKAWQARAARGIKE